MKTKHLYREEIRKILVIYGLSFIIISVIFIYMFLGFYTKYIVKKKNTNYNEFVKNRIYDEVKTYEKMIESVEENYALVDFLENGKNQPNVYELLYDFINKVELKSIFYIVNNKGETILTSNYVKSPYNNYDIFLSGLFKQLKENPDKIVTINNKVQIDLTKRTVYSIGKAILYKGEIKGYIVFDLLESDLKKSIYSSEMETLILTDKYNNAILTNNSMFLDDIGKFSLKPKTAKELKESIINFMDKEYYYYKSKIKNNKIIVYTLSDLNWIKGFLTVIITFLLIIMVMLFFIIVITANYVSKKKTKSITHLMEVIKRVQKGDLKAYVDIKSGDEFETIGRQFNKMLLELDSLIHKNNELVDRNRMSEIKQLESQINPHFIFNTLETLKYMISIDKDNAIKMIINFAKILRYSIDYKTKTTTIEKDLLHLKSYLLIQKYRYNDRLTYEISIDDESKLFIVPKLILQPIVENCIKHSYKNKDKLHIAIDIFSANNELNIKVKDNGAGIKKERLNEIINSLESDNLESESIGVINVHRRLKLIFGDNYGLNIDSKEDVGTIVSILLPKNEG